MELVEVDHSACLAEVSEHAAATDRAQLVRVTDEDEAPAVLVGEFDEIEEVGRAEHAGLVDDQGGAAGRNESVRAGSVFVQQLGDGVRWHRCLCGEHPRRLGCRGQSDGRASIVGEWDGQKDP